MKEQPTILTNMAFWQSPIWADQTTSIYDVSAGEPVEQIYGPLREAWLLWRQNDDFDVVVTMGARTSLLYGLACLLTGKPSKQVMTEVFIDIAKPANPFWHLKNWLYRRVAQRSIGILTNSSSEVKTMAERYKMASAKLRYVPMHSNIAEPHRVEQDEGYVLSAGRTLRDYETLLKAIPSIPAPVHVVCGQQDVREHPLPRNTILHREIDRERYLNLLRKCSLVVLPLLPTPRSTGQVVVLEAMALGKPVVATKAPGTLDLIRHGETGFLVPVGDAVAMARQCRELLKDKELRRSIGAATVQEVKKRFLFDTHARTKLDAIQELWTHYES